MLFYDYIYLKVRPDHAVILSLFPHHPRFMFADSLLPSFQQPASRQTGCAGCFFFAAEPLRYADSCT